MMIFGFRAALLTTFLLATFAGSSLCSMTANSDLSRKPTDSKTLSDSARSSEHLYNLPGLSNVGRIAPGVYRGAQPDKDGFATLKAMGIKTVIDMRTTESEKRQVEAAGMRAVAVPIEMTRNGLKEKVDKMVALMADPANQPVYIHCRHGQDRTGIVAAAYRMKQQGWSLADAEAEMQAFGFNDIWVNFKRFIRQYGAQIEKK